MPYGFRGETKLRDTGHLRSRKALVLVAAVLAAMLVLAPSALATKPAVLTFTVAKIGAPGNPSVGIIPFEDKLFKSCGEAPPPSGSRAPKCMEVGGVGYRYGIGKLEVTAEQYVA